MGKMPTPELTVAEVRATAVPRAAHATAVPPAAHAAAMPPAAHAAAVPSAAHAAAMHATTAATGEHRWRQGKHCTKRNRGNPTQELLVHPNSSSVEIAATDVAARRTRSGDPNVR
jgi:hypothetical protein